ncbi:condensin-2 complex subunit D3 [Ambystoma mexicanum]|uniref:condensin-2 complex subunit D3 n=1 Tax=Ambystoma mexicanum TaxID=8296 RepID=UPI0037E8D875
MSGDREAALLETLQAWGLRALSLAWVDTVWELDFTETEALDSRFQEQITENGVEAFTKLYKCLYPFATEDAGTTENVWTLFAENELSHKALVAVLYHFIQMLESKKANVQQRVYGLHAAGLYFLLLEIPGSVANQVFHPVLFEKCMNTLDNSWPQEAGSSKKRKKDAGKSAQGDARGGKKRAKPTRREAMEMDDISEEEEDQENDIDFSPRDLLQIRETIFRLLRNFLRLLPKFSFREKPQCVMHCLQIFIGLTHFESVLYEMQFSASSDMDRMKYIPELAYRGLWLLCSPVHGEVDQTLRRLFQRILSVILMLHSGEGANPVLLVISAQVANCREQAIRFVSFLVDELKDVAFPAYRILLQHICAKFPDKSDHRTYAAEALVKLLCKFPNAEYASFIEWLYKYSRNSKMSYRVFALEVAVALLELPEREMDNAIPSEQQKFLQHKFLVQVMVFGRCSDKAPSVRSKALSCLAQCLEKKVPTAIEGVQELLQSNASPTVLGSIMSAENSSNSSEATSNQHRKTHATFKTIEVTENDDTTECDGKEVLTMLRLRAGDEKTNVRRAALQVLVNIFKFNVVSFSAEDLSTLKDRCRDPAVSVRKQALQSLTDLLMAQTENVKLQNAWLTGIVPVVIDTESTVQDKALDCLDQLMLQHVKHYSKFRLDDSHQKLAWDLLSRLNEESQELSRYLAKAFYIWSSKDKFSSTFINNLISHTETEHSAAAWMLLAKVAGSSPKLDYTRIIDAWDQTCRNSSASTSTTGHILDVIGHIAKHLPAASRGRLIDDISTWLKEFLSVPEVISPAIEALQKLCHAHASSPEETQELLNRVFGEIVFASQDHISSVVLTEKHVGELDENMLVRHLFTLGEAAQLCPAIVEKRIFLLVQSILASESMEQAIDLRDGDDLPASQPLSQPLSQFKGSTMPPIVRAHAFITLGKLCLQHEDLAKKCVPALARELEVCHDVAVRNNVIIVMCDLCVRYTTMVDRYIPNVSVCLKDSNPFIRKQTLIMLTNLLQEEFVKWKGSLFFRFISVLVDPDPDIASFAEFCLVHLLLKRNPVMFSQHFTECIFHFNCYDKHEKYNKFPQTEREKILFSLKGHDQKEKRMKIYRFLLEHFTDEQRFNLTNKISQNILANFVDGVLPLEMEANELLCDTFEVLSCKEIKLSAMRSKPGEDLQPDDDEMAMANAVMQAAQKKLISQVQKKMFIENIIPIITSLKKFLEQKRIPALRELMNYLREMMQDYRNEIKDFFAVDKQLAAELEYDMKKYEEQLAREQAEQEGLTINAEVPPILGSPQASPRQLQSRTPPATQNGIVVRTPVPEQTVAPAAMPCTPQQRAPFPASFLTPRMGILKSLSRPRQLSLSTAVILNSAKKAVESSKKMRSKSIGALPGTPSPSHVTSSKQVSFDSVNQPSSTSNLTLIGRAISTPDQTINNVTFGAGVSYIGSSHTPASGKVPVRSEDSRKEVLCMMSPDKPVPQPRQWNLASPSHRGSISGQRRSSSRRKSALKPVN